MKIWLDGALTESSQVHLSASSLGLTCGLGVFETLSGEAGFCFKSEQHFARLREGARRLDLSPPEDQVLTCGIQECLEANELTKSSARVRVTLLAGDDTGTRTMISAVPYERPTGSLRLGVSSFRRNSQSATAGIKCVSYAESILALRKAQGAGYDECLMFNEHGNVCECATANVFLCDQQGWFTPPVKSGCLPGVMRSAVLGVWKECGERDLASARLGEITAAFVTNSLRGVQIVKELDGCGLDTEGVEVLELQRQILHAMRSE